MKIASYILFAGAVRLSYIAVGYTSYAYADMQCAIAHRGASAPIGLVFLSLIPFIIAIILCLAFAIHFSRKNKVFQESDKK